MNNKVENKSFSLEALTKGLNVIIKGNANINIVGICTIQSSKPNHLTFLTNSNYKKYLVNTQASAVVLSPEDANVCPVTAIISANPMMVYAKIAAYFYQASQTKSEIHSTAIIGKNCKIAASATISAGAVIGDDVFIGENTFIGPNSIIGDCVEIDANTIVQGNVSIAYRVKIGKRCQIASGVIIGSDGFGFARDNKTWHKIPQLGSVVIGDDVDIGANCAIDRGAVDDTIIENGVKLDNLIQVGHNVRIGENTIIAGCVGIAGSANIGKNCMIGGACGIGGHITIVDNVIITGMTAVSKSIKAEGVYSSGVGGLISNEEWRRTSARLHRLDQLFDRVKDLESKSKLTVEAM